MINFIIQTVILRDELVESNEEKYRFLKLKDLLEFTNHDNQTPLLTAAKFNNLECVKYLGNFNVNIYAVDNKMENVLHHSIYNENE